MLLLAFCVTACSTASPQPSRWLAGPGPVRVVAPLQFPPTSAAIAVDGNHVAVAWTDESQPGRIRLASRSDLGDGFVELPAIDAPDGWAVRDTPGDPALGMRWPQRAPTWLPWRAAPAIDVADPLSLLNPRERLGVGATAPATGVVRAARWMVEVGPDGTPELVSRPPAAVGGAIVMRGPGPAARLLRVEPYGDRFVVALWLDADRIRLTRHPLDPLAVHHGVGFDIPVDVVSSGAIEAAVALAVSATGAEIVWSHRGTTGLELATRELAFDPMCGGLVGP